MGAFFERVYPKDTRTNLFHRGTIELGVITTNRFKVTLGEVSFLKVKTCCRGIGNRKVNTIGIWCIVRLFLPLKCLVIK